MSDVHVPRVAILASGSGSTAEAFIHATQTDAVSAEVGLIICNNPPEKAGIFDRISRLNALYGLDIETAEINSRTHPGGPAERGMTDEESEAICARIDDGNYQHVALMGYMKIVRGQLLNTYGYVPAKHVSMYDARMSNTHPGPLPETEDTYGVGASARVLELGMSASRHTVHVVAAGVDRGPIIEESRVAVLPNDTPDALFSRVQEVEKAVLPLAIDKFLKRQEVLRHGDS